MYVAIQLCTCINFNLYQTIGPGVKDVVKKIDLLKIGTQALFKNIADSSIYDFLTFTDVCIS